MGVEIIRNDLYKNGYSDADYQGDYTSRNTSDVNPMVRGALEYAQRCRANSPQRNRIDTSRYDTSEDYGTITIGHSRRKEISEETRLSRDEIKDIAKETEKELAKNEKTYLKVTEKLQKKEETKKTEDKADIGWGGVGKAVAKGASKLITGMVCDEKGFSWKRLGTTVAMIGVGALACAAFPVAAPAILLGLGAVTGGYQVAKGASKVLEAKTKEEKTKAWEDIGEGGATLVATAVGARSLSKARPLSIKRSLTKTSKGLGNSQREQAVAAEINSLGKGFFRAKKSDTEQAISNIRTLTKDAAPDSTLGKIGAEVGRIDAHKSPISSTLKTEIETQTQEHTAMANKLTKKVESSSANLKKATAVADKASKAAEEASQLASTTAKTRTSVKSAKQKAIQAKTQYDADCKAALGSDKNGAEAFQKAQAASQKSKAKYEAAQNALRKAQNAQRNASATNSSRQTNAEKLAKEAERLTLEKEKAQKYADTANSLLERRTGIIKALEEVQNASSKDEASKAIKHAQELLGELTGENAEMLSYNLTKAEQTLGKKGLLDNFSLNSGGLSHSEALKNIPKSHAAGIIAGTTTLGTSVNNTTEDLEKNIKEAQEENKKQTLETEKINLHAKNFETVANQAKSYGIELPDVDEINEIEDKKKQDEAIQKATKELQAKVDKYLKKNKVKLAGDVA